MGIAKAAASSGDSPTSRLRYDYQPWEFLLPPGTQEELTHKYSVLRRTMMGDNIEKPDPESMSLREGFRYLKSNVNDARDNIQKGTSLQVRYYAAIPLILSPIVLFKRRKLRKCFYSYVLTSYFLLQEPFRAILDAK